MHHSPTWVSFICVEASMTTRFAKRTRQTFIILSFESLEGTYIHDSINILLPYTQFADFRGSGILKL